MSQDASVAPRRARISLRLRWTAALLGASALPLGAFAAATVRIQRAGLSVAEQELEAAVVLRAADGIDRDLDAAAETTHRVGQLLAEGRITDDEARLTLARETLARASMLEHVAVYGPDGQRVDAIVRRGETPAVTALEHLPPDVVNAPGEDGRWLPAETAAGGVALRYVDPLRVDNTVRGWVVGTLDPVRLQDHVAGVSTDAFGRADRVLLADSGLRLLSGGRDGRAPGTALRGTDIFGGVTLPATAFNSPFALTTDFTDARGQRMVGTVRTMPARHWVLAVRRPESEAFEALTGSRNALAVAAGLCAVVAAAVGAWLAARTTRPVRSLVALTRAYGRRDFQPRSTVRTGDELEDLGGALTDMADALAASAREIDRRARVEANLARYLPAEVARSVASGEKTLALGGERRTVAVMFADVAAFTGFAEGTSPERVVAFLNELFTVLAEVVFRHGGMVDKFMGDCVMAVFGATPGTHGEAGALCAQALAAAEDMHRFVESAAPAWAETYGFQARLGIGIHAGEALVGNLGSEARMEYTVIGDVVNVAARLETLARGGQTLVTATVAGAAGEGFGFGPLGSHPLRGKREPVAILELLP